MIQPHVLLFLRKIPNKIKKLAKCREGGILMSKTRKVVDMQSAHLTKAEKQNRRQEESVVITGQEQLKTPPKWLINDVAKKEWRRIVKELKKIEIVGNLDYANLGGYCNAYANYIEVSEKLKEQDYCIERETRTGTIIVKNPLVTIQKEYANEMRKFAALCGLTIDSRLKAAVTKRNKTDENVTEMFGAI